mmetsp:Transcript_116690/g.330668  ORF Transcript_116690/g.330668 Transcript_116690/m.330668 type:complete len:206 (-) Transcript_116690:620-1237(-)
MHREHGRRRDRPQAAAAVHHEVVRQRARRAGDLHQQGQGGGARHCERPPRHQRVPVAARQVHREVRLLRQVRPAGDGDVREGGRHPGEVQCLRLPGRARRRAPARGLHPAQPPGRGRARHPGARRRRWQARQEGEAGGALEHAARSHGERRHKRWRSPGIGGRSCFKGVRGQENEEAWQREGEGSEGEERREARRGDEAGQVDRG